MIPELDRINSTHVSIGFSLKFVKRNLEDLYTESGQTLQCSLSSVSTPPIARVDSFFSIKKFSKSTRVSLLRTATNSKIQQNLPYFPRMFFTEISFSFAKFNQVLTKFRRNFTRILLFHRIGCSECWIPTLSVSFRRVSSEFCLNLPSFSEFSVLQCALV